jgi:hypothetical protein
MTTSIARAEIADAMRRRIVEHLRAADFHGTVIAPAHRSSTRRGRSGTR